MRILKKLLIQFYGDYVLNRYSLKKIKCLAIFFLYILFTLNPLLANESKDHLLINFLVMTCYEDKKFCNKALLRVHDYQKNAAINKNFSCQTRLLGLEANLIMAMNSNFKRKDANSIIDAIEKYC